MIRATTIGVLKNYRSGLNKSFVKMNDARTTFMTHRNFNSFAEDPSGAALSFQLRRSRMTVESQLTVCDNAYRRHQSAWKAIETAVNDVDNTSKSMEKAILEAMNDTTGHARTALGKTLDQMAEAVVQVMNNKYGDDFLFSGADGQTIPFSWDENGALLYRGIPVDAKDGTRDLEKLDYLAKEEKLFQDIGLGNEEDENGKIISTSVFDATLQGINFLGYGVDEDGDPKNIVSLAKKMAEICGRQNGDLTGADKDELQRVAGKFEKAASELHTQHAAMDAGSGKLKNNLDQLNQNYDTLTEQYAEIEDVDDADAISAFLWASYSYNAALRVGNSVLAQSLMDYMQ